MNEVSFVLLALLFLVAFLTAVVLFVVAWRHNRRLTVRLDQVEQDLARLSRSAIVSAPGAEAASPSTPPVREQPHEDARIVEAALTARLQRVEEELARLVQAALGKESEPALLPTPAAVEPVVSAIPEIPVQRTPRRPLPEPPVPDAAAIEAWIGQHGLAWAAVVLLLFATAFFLKYAFENQWIGELGRVSLGIVAGSALCWAGRHYHQRHWRLFSQMLTEGGVVLLYLATYAAFAYYRLIPREQAAVFLAVLIAETAALAVLYDAPAIALMAVIGGLLNPILLRTGLDQYRALFPYLVLLNAGFVGLSMVRDWRAVSTLALLGTQGLFWAWYDEHYHPAKLAPALGFQVALFTLFLIQSVVHAPRQRTHSEDLLRLIVNAFLFALAGHILLDDDFHAWMGSLALGMAMLYSALGWLLLRRTPQDVGHILVATATGLAFLATVFLLEANASWIGVGWAVEGLAVWWFGLRIRAGTLRFWATVLLVLAVGRLVFVDTPWLGRAPFVPVFNKYAIPALAISACVVVAAVLSHRFIKKGNDLEVAAQVGLGLAGVCLVWLVLSVDTYQFWVVRIGEDTVDPTAMRRTAQASLSVLWAIYAAVMLAIGFRIQSDHLRWSALGLFGVTLGKVFLVDMAGLPGFYRVTAFFVLSLMMGAAAWGYQKIEATRPASRV